MNGTKLTAVVGTAAALIAACSASKATSTSSTSAPSSTLSTSPAAGVTSASSSVTASTSPTSPRSSSAPVAGPVLSGRWKGTYSGAYTGTFVLRWAQSTSKLTGTIDLSTAPGAVTIEGTIAGGRIQFGTVGSQAITYTGSVTRASMRGRYKVAGGAGGSGAWSATRN
jgi:hypothetical protein